MSHEILYTSAPRLLKPGMTGYGTVVSTRGISSHLADKLESLSGYRWAFEQGDPQARLNPVCHSHVVIAVAGQKYHVLSRVADYGADYSGRSNKIAHHVALSESELTPGGPGWVLKAPGFCEARWDEQLKVIDAGRQPTRSVRDSADYSVWKRVMGDAGWAGALAETVGSTDRRAVHMIFPLGTDTLGLVEESLNLLPHRDRWNVSFSTYYNVLPASVDCHWRFVLDGTPEATNLRRQPHQRIIDLCRPLGPPIGGELVQHAKDGWQPAFGPPPHAPVMAAVQPQSTAAVSQPRPAAPAASPIRVDADVPEQTGPAYSPPLPSRYSASNSGSRPPVKSGWRMPLWATLLLCLLIAAGAGGVGFWQGQRSATPEIAKAPSTVQTEKELRGQLPESQENREENNLPTPATPPSAPAIPTVAPVPAVSSVDPPAPATDVPEVPTDPGAGVAVDPPRDAKEMQLDKPSNGGQLENTSKDKEIPGPNISSSNTWNHEHILADGVQKFSPEFFGATTLLESGKDFELENVSLTEWKVMSSSKVAPLAILRLQSNKVTLQWKEIDNNKEEYDVFRRCLVRLESGKKPFRLSKPVEIEGPAMFSAEMKNGFPLSGTADPELVFPSASVGKWRLSNMPDNKYSILNKDLVSTFGKLTNDPVKLTIGCEDDKQIAELRLEFKHADSRDTTSLRSTVEVQLWASFPVDTEKPECEYWLEGARNSAGNKHTLDGITKSMELLATKTSIAEKALVFAKLRWKDDGTLAKEGDGEAFELKELSKKLSRNSDEFSQLNLLLDGKDKNLPMVPGKGFLVASMQEKLKQFKIQNALLDKQIAWRKSMDELTGLLKSTATFSFDVWYDCPVGEENPRQVTLGTVTTKSPSR